MPDRLQELIQQRRLIEQHLAWLNREIAAATALLAPAEVSSLLAHPTKTPAGLTMAPRAGIGGKEPLEAAVPLPEADTILAEYEQNPQNLEQSVKRGCLLYFGAAMFILILGVFLLYLYRVNHPLPVPPAKSTPVEGR